MKLKITLIFVFLISTILLFGCGKSKVQDIAATTTTTSFTAPDFTTTTLTTGENTLKEKIIEITEKGFNPSTITLNQGETVVFINKDITEHWPASALHPTHAVYPEPGGCIGSKFDSCKGLIQNEKFSFTFNQAGTWKYHDHIDASLRGTIIVE